MTPILFVAALLLAIYAWSQLAPDHFRSAFGVVRRGQVQRAGLIPVSRSSPSITGVGTVSTPGNPGGLFGIPLPLVVRRLDAWSRSVRAWLIVGTLGMCWYGWSQFLLQNDVWAAMCIWLGGVSSFVALVAEPPSWRFTFSAPRAEWVLACIVLALGAVLRLYRLGDVPYGLNPDAAYNGLVALQANHSPAYLPWSPDPTRGETLFAYCIVAIIAVVGPTPLAIHAAAAVVGIATLVALYLLAQRLLGARVALIATALLATSGWHLLFSRAGWWVITLPLVETLALYAVLRAIETRRRLAFALAGALLALQLDTYADGRVLLVVALVWALAELWRNSNSLALLRGYALAALTFALAGAPLLAFAITNPSIVGAPSGSPSLLSRLLTGDASPLWQHVQSSLGFAPALAAAAGMTIVRPLLDAPASWLLVLGVVLSIVWAARRSRVHALLLVGLVVGLLPGLSAAGPSGDDGAGAIPFACILAALPLVALLDAFAPWRKQLAARRVWLRHLPDAIVALILLVVLGLAFGRYLGPGRVESAAFYPQATAVGRYLRQIDARYDPYVTPDYPADVLTYLTYDETLPPAPGSGPQLRAQAQDSGQFVTDTARPGRGLAFVMPPGQGAQAGSNAMARGLRSRYPSAIAFTLLYRDDARSRLAPAAVVVLVPPAGATASRDIPRGAVVSH